MGDEFGRSRKVVQSLIDRGSRIALRASDRLRAGSKASIDVGSELSRTQKAPLSELGPEPPVVARLMIEIRSDGSRTIARGALEDLISEKNVAVQAEGRTPAELARSLTGTLLSLPFFVTKIAKSLKQK